jgi:hypothetical protein
LHPCLLREPTNTTAPRPIDREVPALAVGLVPDPNNTLCRHPIKRFARIKLESARLSRGRTPPERILETALYLPVKRHLEKLGFTVKGEVGGCDLVALSGDEPPVVVIGELKLAFNLELILQAVDRAGAADEVWVAARLSARGKGRESDARYRNLCRRLGFGMLAVTNTGDVEVIVQPATTAPRRNPKKRSRLVAEHRKRKGDPAIGGSTRAPIMTAYRQQALACASALSGGPRRVKDLRIDIPDAGKILLHNVYGWFDRSERGVYVLTDSGHAALKRWPQQPLELGAAGNSAP